MNDFSKRLFGERLEQNCRKDPAPCGLISVCTLSEEDKYVMGGGGERLVLDSEARLLAALHLSIECAEFNLLPWPTAES
jgi:hypothetical protein